MKNLIDLHTHTILSGHAYSSLLENVNEAKKKDLLYYGVSDHAPAMPGGAHIYAISNMKIIPSIIEGINVLKGVEVNIMNEYGDLDLTENDLADLDYAIASIHGPCYGPSKGIILNTEAYIGATKHANVKILGHIDDARIEVDYEYLIRYCAENDIVIEINNSSLRPESFRKNAKVNVAVMLELCKKYNCYIIMNSDAHVCFDVGRNDYALEALKAVSFPNELIVNYSNDLIKRFFLQ